MVCSILFLSLPVCNRVSFSVFRRKLQRQTPLVGKNSNRVMEKPRQGRRTELNKTSLIRRQISNNSLATKFKKKFHPPSDLVSIRLIANKRRRSVNVVFDENGALNICGDDPRSDSIKIHEEKTTRHAGAGCQAAKAAALLESDLWNRHEVGGLGKREHTVQVRLASTHWCPATDASPETDVEIR